MRIDLVNGSFEYCPRVSKKERDALAHEAMLFHGRVLDLAWDMSQEAQMISGGEFELFEVRDMYENLFAAYPAGVETRIKLDDYKDADPRCKFNAVLNVSVCVMEQWCFNSTIYFEVRTSEGEAGDVRDDIEDIYVRMVLDATGKAGFDKLKSWIDLQPFVAKSANLGLNLAYEGA